PSRPLYSCLHVRVRRARQGAVTAVSDLARAARAARARPPRARCLAAARRRPDRDADLLSAALLGVHLPPAPRVARPAAQPDPRCAARDAQPAGTRTGSQLVARPSAPHSTSTPSIRTSPVAGSRRTGKPVTNR